LPVADDLAALQAKTDWGSLVCLVVVCAYMDPSVLIHLPACPYPYHPRRYAYFTRQFIMCQLLLHLTYMALFISYAFSIKVGPSRRMGPARGSWEWGMACVLSARIRSRRTAMLHAPPHATAASTLILIIIRRANQCAQDMEPVDRDSGSGASVPGCTLPPPTRTQTGLLAALAVITCDYLLQEARQVSLSSSLVWCGEDVAVPGSDDGLSCGTCQLRGEHSGARVPACKDRGVAAKLGHTNSPNPVRVDAPVFATQLRHFGLQYFNQAWDLLDFGSVGIVCASIV
jgi:hypothetical protein